MGRLEYKTVVNKGFNGTREMDIFLNKWAAIGWQLVTVQKYQVESYWGEGFTSRSNDYAWTFSRSTEETANG